MQNPWFSDGRASRLNPSSLAADEGLLPPPPIPPDPPDPSPLSIAQFPPLSSPSNPKPKASPQTAPSKVPVEQSSVLGSPTTTDVEMSQASPGATAELPKTQSIPSIIADSSTVQIDPKTISTVQKTLTQKKNFTTLPPKSSNPLHTNKASSSKTSPATTLPNPIAQTAEPVLPNPNNLPPKPLPAPTLAERIKVFEDKSLMRLAPIAYSLEGVPRVLIPDEVFEQGAEIHKDFIVCYFNGRAPPYSQIQSVLNHMWGKGKRLEIHNNLATRSMIVRIQSDYLRSKILEKGVWYVGDSMFHTAQWTADHSSDPTPQITMQLWAHLTGVPLNLRHHLTLAHVKVEVKLTKELPRVVEFERTSGAVVEVLVDYPWMPPTCSHCKELGHIAKNCLLLPVPEKVIQPPVTKGQTKKEYQRKNKGIPDSEKTPEIPKVTPNPKNSIDFPPNEAQSLTPAVSPPLPQGDS
ncbi:unnamed protein product [Microthlaspi erraticum]|uniref:DUF4283 domain-containing protein n=1 Tax=Microthlaspi erraticum TaxID=1685480 RepID=A0A6D2HSF3_9BRAS|nr:unnamed protein product [Microthlaspi erraticum]